MILEIFITSSFMTGVIKNTMSHNVYGSLFKHKIANETQVFDQPSAMQKLCE
jgi:hypothetical protein